MADVVVGAGLPDAQSIRQTAHDILSSGEFEEKLERSGFEDLQRNIAEFLDKIYSPFRSMGESLLAVSPVLYYIVVVIMVLILALLIFHIVYSLQVSLKRRILHPVASGNISELTPEELLLQAEQNALQGYYSAGLRLLLRSALLRLGNGKLRRAATNREYIRQYKNSAACKSLKALVDLVDYKWFGGQQCAYSDWQHGLMAHDEISRIVSFQRNEKNDSEVKEAGIC